MIKINKVEQLGKERETVRYGDLKYGKDVYLVENSNLPRIKIEEGELYICEDRVRLQSHWGDGLLVTLVDAEINWAYRD